MKGVHRSDFDEDHLSLAEHDDFVQYMHQAAGKNAEYKISRIDVCPFTPD